MISNHTGLLLNLGAGGHHAPDDVMSGMHEVSVDIRPPADVVADIRALPFADEYADAVYSSHVIEHFDERELVPMVSEWRRVLKTGGRLHIKCPDIGSAAQFIGANGVDAIAYTTDEGIPIRGHDILFGYVGYIANQGEPMRHKSALDIRKLAHVLHQAGFDNGTVTQNGGWFALSATAIK
jgi:SAM-dependent methyltransferase